VVKHWQGIEIGIFEDNATRQRATELLADLLSVRKQTVDGHHSGDIEIIPAPAPSEDED